MKKQEFPIETILDDSEHKDLMMKDEDMETLNKFKQLQAQQHQPTTQTTRRSKEECLLLKDIAIATIEKCYNGEYYLFTVPNSIQHARSAPDAVLCETVIQNEINSVFQNNTLSKPMILPEGK